MAWRGDVRRPMIHAATTVSSDTAITDSRAATIPASALPPIACPTAIGPASSHGSNHPRIP